MPVNEMRIKLANDLSICSRLYLSSFVGTGKRKVRKERAGSGHAPLANHAFPVDSPIRDSGGKGVNVGQ